MIEVWALQENGSAQRVEINPDRIRAIFKGKHEVDLIVLDHEEYLTVDRFTARLVQEQWDMHRLGVVPMSRKPMISTLEDLIRDRLEVAERNRKRG